MCSRRVLKVVRAMAILLMAGSAIGFLASLLIGAFVLDKYNSYGEVPVPGAGKVHLPVGRVAVSFHSTIVGTNTHGSSGGLPIPHLALDIDPPASVADPKITENVGSSASVNGDIHRRVWEVQIATEGDYIVTTSGDVNGFIFPHLAFGHDSDSNDAWTGITAGLFVIGLIGTTIASVRLRSTGHAQREPLVFQVGTPVDEPIDAPVVVPSGQGVKIEQLKTLAALRDSGALTEKEFQAEKRRVLQDD